MTTIPRTEGLATPGQQVAHLIAGLHRIREVCWPGAAVDHAPTTLVEGKPQIRIRGIIVCRVCKAPIHLHASTWHDGHHNTQSMRL